MDFLTLCRYRNVIPKIRQVIRSVFDILRAGDPRPSASPNAQTAASGNANVPNNGWRSDRHNALPDASVGRSTIVLAVSSCFQIRTHCGAARDTA
jgi:hypothetical protein